MSRTTERAIDLAGVAVTLGLLASITLGLAGPLRVALALAFVSFVPGWALLAHVRIAQSSSKLALAVAISLSSCAGLATSLLWLRLWHPTALLIGLGAACAAALLVDSTPRRQEEG